MSSPRSWLASSPLRSLRAELGDRLAGVYLIGSAALDDWHAGVSDVDAAVLTHGEADARTLTALAGRLSADTATMPARRLELVVYAAERVAAGDATFSMNLNVEDGVPVTVDLDPATVPRFWFVLDLAIAREHGIAVVGRPPAEAIGPIPEAEVRAALEESVDWHTEEGGDPAAMVLAGARALHRLRTGTWVGKTDAARWAARELPELAPTIEAVAARRAAT